MTHLLIDCRMTSMLSNCRMTQMWLNCKNNQNCSLTSVCNMQNNPSIEKLWVTNVLMGVTGFFCRLTAPAHHVEISTSAAWQRIESGSPAVSSPVGSQRARQSSGTCRLHWTLTSPWSFCGRYNSWFNIIISSEKLNVGKYTYITINKHCKLHFKICY